MKRFAINLLSSFLAFAAGLGTASSWNRNRLPPEPAVVKVIERCPPGKAQPSAPPAIVQSSFTRPDFVFAQGRLKLVPETVELKSESRRYKIEVSYPQIVGTDAPHIRNINQHIKELATQKYQWPLNPSKENLRYAEKEHPGAYNSVNVDYQVGVATDSFLSIFFFGYSNAIRNDESVEESLTVNYDLTSGKQLKLSDFFKRGSKYLEFISRFCAAELLTAMNGDYLSREALAPVAENFKNWNVTSNGITFNFNGCKIFKCKEGDQTVEIPFSDLRPFLNPGIPGKFQITYP